MVKTNAQMIAGRYLRWHRARRLIADIQSCLQADGVAVVSTHTNAAQFDRRHVDHFKAMRSGAYMRRGKGWDCIDGCAVRLYRRRAA